jgi:hypothetical protein
MVELRPESLLRRDRNGQSPVEWALCRPLDERSREVVASILPELVALRPGSVVPRNRISLPVERMADSALMSACKRFSACPDLIAAILRAHPAALCLASGRLGVALELPLEASTVPPGLVVPAFVATETLNLTLAVVEYVLGAAFAHDDKNAAWVQKHVQNTVATFLPNLDVVGFSGFAVAKAINKLRSRMDVCRALFRHASAFLLLRMSQALRNKAFGSTPLLLYDMNRRGRFNDDVTAHQHVDLLELANDSIECIYLHLRDNWVHLLMRHGDPSGKGIAASHALNPTTCQI